eukprot:m.261409 g.261409  ORF g.261409 m.261409 type:complete len:381 (+) comp42140_c0_seq1:102-1244(+)
MPNMPTGNVRISTSRGGRVDRGSAQTVGLHARVRPVRRLISAMIGLLVFCTLLHGGMGSSQGLYVLTPMKGQLMLVNWTTGTSTPVGDPLSKSGWWLDACSPTTLDQTGKWIYTLARRGNATGPLTLVAMQLADGVVHRATYTLASQGFDPSASACDHAVASAGDWFAYVSAIVTEKKMTSVNNNSMMTTKRLRTVAFTCLEWPGKPTLPPAVVIDQLVSEIGLADTATVHSGTIDFLGRLWLQLDHGVAGAMTYFRNRTKVDRIVPMTGGQISMSGLQTGNGAVFGLLEFASGVRKIASFPIDDPSPAVQVVHNTSLPFHVQHNGTAIALLSDQQGIVFATTEGTLATVNLTHGSAVATYSPVCVAGRAAGISYEPYVF